MFTSKLPWLQVHVASAYQSRMLFNAEDIQGGPRVKEIAKRGAQKKSSVAQLETQFSGRT
jgi:hypothetical protein